MRIFLRIQLSLHELPSDLAFCLVARDAHIIEWLYLPIAIQRNNAANLISMLIAMSDQLHYSAEVYTIMLFTQLA